ncbi:hypothetical protein OROMI_003799 [Orobanche minor]
MESHTSCSINRLHIFWQILIIGDGVDTTEFVDPSTGVESEDQRYFQALVDEVRQHDPAVVRNISLIIHDYLHPDQTSYVEPQVNTTVKVDQKEVHRLDVMLVVESIAKGVTVVPGHPVVKAAALLHQSTMPFHRAHHRAEIGNYHHIDKILGIILPFVEGYLDVPREGNCGFRVVADYIFGDQDKWHLVRVCIANEIMANYTLYRSIYYDGIEPEVRRLIWDGGACGSDHWMAVDEDLFPIATILNDAVILFEFG